MFQKIVNYIPALTRLQSMVPKGTCRSQELQAYQPELGAREDYGEVHPECAHQASKGQPGNQAQPAWVHENQVLLDQPDLL